MIEAVAKKSCTEAIEAEKRCWTDGQEESESGNVKIGAYIHTHTYINFIYFLMTWAGKNGARDTIA